MTLEQLKAQYEQDWWETTGGAVDFEEWLAMNNIQTRSISTPEVVPAAPGTPMLGGAPAAGPIAGPTVPAPAIGGAAGSGPAPGTVPPIATSAPAPAAVARTNRDKIDPKVADAIDAYVAKDPTQAALLDGQNGGDYLKYVEFFKGWWEREIENVDPADYPDDMKILDAMGVEVEGGEPGSTDETPLQADLLETAYNDYILPDLAKDPERQKYAAEQLAGLQGNLAADRSLVNSMTTLRVNPANYLAANPDLVTYYNANKRPDGTLPDFPGVTSIEEFATMHWNSLGRKEGRQPGAGAVSEMLGDEYFNNAVTKWKQDQGIDAWKSTMLGNITDDEAARHNNLLQQTKAYRDNITEREAALFGNLTTADGRYRTTLENQLAGLKSNLDFATGEYKANLGDQVVQLGGNIETALGEKNAALGVNVAAKDAAIGTQTAAQRAALETMLTAMRGNLDAETAAKAEGLQRQLDALDAGIGVYTEAERKAIADQVTANFASLEAEVGARKGALEAELTALGGAIDAQSVARKAALETELGKLTEAQKPLSAARIAGAEAQGAAINLGVQSERDRIMAEMAQQGYIGGSTGTDQALLRATIQGRQGAAQSLADATIANAGDDRELAAYGAQQGRALSDEEARGRYDLARYGAGQTRNEAIYDAQGRRTISDFDAAAKRNLAGQEAGMRYDLTAFGAEEDRRLADESAANVRILGDKGAFENRVISDNDAGQRKDLAFWGADQTRDISEWGTSQRKDLADFEDNTWAAIRNDQIKGTKDISDFGTDETARLDNKLTAEGKTIYDRSAEDRSLTNIFEADQRADLFNSTADKRYGVNSQAADGIRENTDTAALRDLAYFNNDITRRLGALGTASKLVNDDLALRTKLDAYGNTGLNRALGLLGYFSTSTGSPAGAASPGYTPDTSGSTIGSAWQNGGAALAGVGMDIFKLNMDRNKTPAPAPAPAPTPTPTGGFFDPNTPGDPTKAYGL